MNRIHVEQRKKLDLNDWKKRSPVTQDYGRLLVGSSLIYEAGKLKVVYLELSEDLEAQKWAVSTIKYNDDFRTAGMKTRSRVFGHQPRITIRRDFCTATALASEFPKQNQALCAGAWVAAKYYQQWNPALHDEHQRITETKVRPEYWMSGSLFTSGIVNDNNPLLYHHDTGNYKDVWSGMLTFKDDIEGGYLSLPEFGVGLRLSDRSLLLFDGQGILHGVTPIKKKTEDAHRYTIVYYSLQGMWKCLSPEEELRRIRKLRTEREEKRARQ